MAYFLPSYFQKRILRYVLQKLDLLDAEQINLENLDIVWGKRSVIELRDVGVQLKKLASLLRLPPQLVLVKANIKLLRVTIPADLYTSGIVTEIEGVDIRLDVDTLFDEDGGDGGARTAEDESSSAGRHSSTSSSRSLRPKVHDPGGEPPTLSGHVDGREDDSDSLVLPTTDDLAKSFLQAEPRKEKAELRAAVAQSQHIEEKDILGDPEQESMTGVGTGLSLPTFLSGFLKGIEQRFRLRLQDVQVDVVLRVELPANGSVATAGSDRSENVTLRFSIRDVEYGNVSHSVPCTGSGRSQPARPAPSSYSSTVDTRWGVRQIRFSNIHGAVLSDASIFSSLLPSLAPSSTSESTAAGSPPTARRKAQHTRANLGELPTHADVPSPLLNCAGTSSYMSLLGLSQRSSSSDGLGVGHKTGTTPTGAEPKLVPTLGGSPTQNETISDDSNSDDGDDRSTYQSTYNIADSPKREPLEPSTRRADIPNSFKNRSTQVFVRTELLAEKQASCGRERQLGLVPPIKLSSTGVQHNPSPPGDDLAESKIFSHEEAESMYMSAMSNMDIAGQAVDQHIPGAWDSHAGDDETAKPTSATDASTPRHKLASKHEPRESSPIKPGADEGHVSPLHSSPLAVPSDLMDARNIDAARVVETSFISKETLHDPKAMKASNTSEAGTEGSLVVSKLFMVISNISLEIPHTDLGPTSPTSASPRPVGTMSTSRTVTRDPQVRFESPVASYHTEGSISDEQIRDSVSVDVPEKPKFGIVSPSTEGATSVKIHAVEFKTDLGLARLTALIIKQIGKIFSCHTSMRQKEVKSMTNPQAETRILVETIAWNFYDRVVSSPAVREDGTNAQIGTGGSLGGSELLLKATVQGLQSVSQTTSDAYKSEVSVAKIAFSHTSGNIITFDSSLKMRESTHDVLTPADRDAVLTVWKDARASRIELATLPIHVRLDLRRLDEAFAWLGGFSSILDLGNSMISTVTTLGPVKSKKKQSHKSSRVVHFEGSGAEAEAKASASHDSMPRKVTARVGGLICTLLGSESSLRFEGSALKAVSRAEGVGLQVDRINLSGLYLNNAADQPAIVFQLFNVRMEYLSKPKEVDLARLLALLSPSRDKYEMDDDILLDTLLRQRRQGGLVRLTAERSENRILNLNGLQRFSTLAEELKRLGTVTKYLPEDDRPGILTLALVRQLRCKAEFGGSLGLMEAGLKNIELAHVTLPNLVALGISQVHLCRNEVEELVAVATPAQRREESSLPMVMARFVGNEMEPTVKVKLYNVLVEYHVPFILAVMDWSAGIQPEDLLADMAGSIATLTERQRWKSEGLGSRHDATASSSTTSPTHTALNVDVTIRDSLIGLNPRKSSAKGMVVLTETHFAGTVPIYQQAHATLEVRKAALMIVDDQGNVKQPESHAQQLPAQCGVSQLQALEVMGYVSDPQTSSRCIDIEIKDELFVLESCADSTQTLQTILNGLPPPLPPSKDVRYRTAVVPIEDMLSSFSGMAFTSDGPKLEGGEADGSPLEDDQESTSDEALPDTEMGASFYDLELSRQYDGITDSILHEDADSVMVDSPAQELKGEEPPLSSSYHQIRGDIEGPPLQFQEDHFGSSSSVGGSAHRWNTKHNSYGLPDEFKIRQSPLRVRVRDVHVIWNLFDGYDWQHTRDTISKAITDVETKAFHRQSRREKRKPQDDEGDEESVIGDFLFNSIYIGIPANKDPRNLSQQVSRNLDDVASESEHSAPSTVSSSPSRPRVSSPARSKRPRLARSKHHKMTFELKGISADLVVFPPGSGETQSSIDVRVQGLEVFDHVPTSTWKKFATYMQDAGERESGSSMIHLEIQNVRPVPDLIASEIILKATVLPLRLHVDQDALDFLTRFFEFKEDSSNEAAAKTEAAFLQRVEVNSIRLRLDFKPKRVDYAGIRSGHTNEFMNFFTLDRADMVLRHVIIYGISGFDRLGKTLNDIWMPDIKRNQLPGVLAGLAPVRSLVNVGSGVRDLVVIPIQEYQKDGRIVRSLQKGALAFAKTTTSELVKLGAKLAIGTQTVLQGAEDLLTQPEHHGSAVASGWEEAELDEEEKKRISLYADQPVGVIQGLRGAYASLERDLVTAKDAIVAMPGEVMESGTAGGAAKAVLRGAPTVILRPALGVSKAVGRTLMGATNSLDPENRRRIEEKYKKH